MASEEEAGSKSGEARVSNRWQDPLLLDELLSEEERLIRDTASADCCHASETATVTNSSIVQS